MTAPEPWREQPPAEKRALAQDPLAYYYARGEPSEFGFGSGLVAKSLNGLPPANKVSTWPAHPASTRPLAV
jgi:hypothetical protein